MRHFKVKIVFILLVFHFILGGCGGKTTTSGLIATFDFRKDLPPEVLSHAPSDDNAIQYSAEIDVPHKDVGKPISKIVVRWRCFNYLKGKYILSASLYLNESYPGLEIKGASKIDPLNLGPYEAPLMGVDLRVTWYLKHILSTQSGVVGGFFVADGTWKKD